MPGMLVPGRVRHGVGRAGRPGGSVMRPDASGLVNSTISQRDPERVRIVTYTGGAVYVDAPLKRTHQTPPPNRSGTVVRELSDAARKRMAFAACQMADKFSMMATLTITTRIRPTAEAVARARNAWLQGMRREGRPFFWFLEFTQAGWPHVHVFLGGTHPGVPVRIPGKRGGKPRLVYLEKSRSESARWAGLLAKAVEACPDVGDVQGGMPGEECMEEWGHAFALMSRASVRWERLEAGKSAARYAVKYASKANQKECPEWWAGGRWWGYGGCEPEEAKTETVMAHKILPIVDGEFQTEEGTTVKYRRLRWYSQEAIDFVRAIRFASQSGHAVTEGNENGSTDWGPDL